jgi:hypothetical protein
VTAPTTSVHPPGSLKLPDDLDDVFAFADLTFEDKAAEGAGGVAVL